MVLENTTNTTSNEPKISIVTTVWNLYENDRVEMFRQMMESVHNQTYKNIEHIITYRESTDNTFELLQEYVKKGWAAQAVLVEENGIWHGMNKGLEVVTGEFINFMNSDDYFYCDNAVELSVNALMKSGASWSYGYTNRVNPDNVEEVLFEWYFEDYTSIYNAKCPNHQTLFVKTDLLKQQNGFLIDLSIPGSFSDDLSMMRLLFAGHIPVLVPEVLVVFRNIDVPTKL